MSRRVVDTICPRCWTYTATGDDDDRCAFSATVEPQPLTRSGELLAVIAGHTVYENHHGALYRRDRWMVAGPASHPVVADHRCDHPIPSHWRMPAPPTVRPTEGVMF